MSDVHRRTYRVFPADPEAFWLVPSDSNDPNDWAHLEQSDPVKEIESLRSEVERLQNESSQSTIDTLRAEIKRKDRALLSAKYDAERVEYYKETLCVDNGQWVCLPRTGAAGRAIDPEKLGDVLEERESLRAEVAKEKEGIKSLRAQYDSVVEMKDKRIEELERGTVELNDYIREILCGPDHIITLDQITKAWEYATYRSVGPDAIWVLTRLNIHRCEVCGGSGHRSQTLDHNAHGKPIKADLKCPDCAEWGSNGFVVKS